MKALVSLSGGRDSATCLGVAVDRYGAENVFAMGFEYGSTHPQELEHAQMIADYYGVPYQVVTIDPAIFAGSTCTMLKGSEKEIEKGKTYEEILAEKEANGETAKVSSYVPARNTIFGSYVLARAESLVEQYNHEHHVQILLGLHGDDSGFYIDENGNEQLDYTKSAYPDTSVAFANAFAEVAKISSVGYVEYDAPFVRNHKWELIKTGLTLDKPVPYNLTLSCYDPIVHEDGSVEECGECATCLDCIKAMTLAANSLTDAEWIHLKESNSSLYEYALKYKTC